MLHESSRLGKKGAQRPFLPIGGLPDEPVQDDRGHFGNPGAVEVAVVQGPKDLEPVKHMLNPHPFGGRVFYRRHHLVAGAALERHLYLATGQAVPVL